MCCERNLYTTFSPTTQSVIIGNGDTIKVLGCGQIKLEVFNGKDWIDTTINNVLFVPELKTNLFSVNCAMDTGYIMKTDGNKCKFYKGKALRAIANRVGNMYMMNVRYKSVYANVTQVKSTLDEWHQKMAHQNIQYVKTVLQNNNIEVSEYVNGNTDNSCHGCLKGKIHRLPFKTSKSNTTRICEVIHADLCGPMENNSIGGSRYFMILKDDFSRFSKEYNLLWPGSLSLEAKKQPTAK
ncbi:hypothetical protein K1T71_009710 [Dendrolimus kikuchii]|uniref:Uncharacterized protein n=1 Tax=Dendrolimus kikuchii TaxID=765133 RepID=A0ACC1CSL6_9NEOP|nr:hypothetical protein K1T71_009710 [Dendrolimus kikuchii]